MAVLSWLHCAVHARGGASAVPSDPDDLAHLHSWRDAIHTQARTRQQFDADNQRAAALHEALHLARLRYRNGVASQLGVLDSERNLLDAELNLSDALRAHRTAIADLFKALGGVAGIRLPEP